MKDKEMLTLSFEQNQAFEVLKNVANVYQKEWLHNNIEEIKFTKIEYWKEQPYEQYVIDEVKALYQNEPITNNPICYLVANFVRDEIIREFNLNEHLDDLDRHLRVEDDGLSADLYLTNSVADIMQKENSELAEKFLKIPCIEVLSFCQSCEKYNICDYASNLGNFCNYAIEHDE